MSDDELTPERVAALTAAVDIEAPPPDGEPVALVLFGTNQAAPAQLAAARYHAGTAPLVIATGGVNRHNGIIEGPEFARQLTQAGVPAGVIRVEDQSKDTWQNVELSLPYLREALAMGLRLAVVSKWYHLRTVQPAHPVPRSRLVPRHLLGTGLRGHPGHPGQLAEDPRRPPPGTPRIPGSPPPRRRRKLPRRPQGRRSLAAFLVPVPRRPAEAPRIPPVSRRTNRRFPFNSEN